MTETNEELTVPEEWTNEVESAPEYSLLRVWSEILANVEQARNAPVNMVVCSKIVASWPQITFQECPIYHAQYHHLLLEARGFIERAIADNPGAIDHQGEEDVRENFDIYKQLVIDWNIMLDEHELAWDAAAEDSHITFGALVDTRAFLFSRTGLAGHLEARGFEITMEEVTEAILEARGDK